MMKKSVWNFNYIDGQLKFRLLANVQIKIEAHPFTGGNFTQMYYFKDKKIMVYNRKPNGNLIGNFVISDLVKDDPKKAVEFNGRTGPGTFGKRLVISKCGDTDMEKFNYISELLYQVIKRLN